MRGDSRLYFESEYSPGGGIIYKEKSEAGPCGEQRLGMMEHAILRCGAGGPGKGTWRAKHTALFTPTNHST